MYKHIALLVRKADMTHEEFVEHWQEEHTPIASEIEGVVRYATVLPVDPESSAFDGLAELYFEELDALFDALGSESARHASEGPYGPPIDWLHDGEREPTTVVGTERLVER